MATGSQSQQRCVFVGNIPYDATEEQLIQICEEVGPVVSFRLVIDRETGKPKGYGFCEYKDEETALSARRNLQGYEINGRQLRVDFAENDKNADRNREQGRGGPGVVSNMAPQKQHGGPAVLGQSGHHLPVGDSVAMAAATVMSGALGAAQTSSTLDQIGLQSQSLFGIDPLTNYLAKMSRSQLMEVLAELKAMAMQNKEQVRQLLLVIPNLSKALFQAQIMLGMVPPQMIPNIRQASAQPVQPSVQSAQPLSGLPPLPQNKMQVGLLPYAQEIPVSAGLPNQYNAVQQFPTLAHKIHPQLLQNQALQPGQLPGQPGVSSLPSVGMQSLGVVSVGSHGHAPTSSLLNQKLNPSVLHNASQVPPSDSRNKDQRMPQNASIHPSMLMRPQYSAAGFQPSSSTSSTMLENMDLKGHAFRVPGKRVASDSMDQTDRASKISRLNDGTATPMRATSVPMSVPFPTSDLPGKQTGVAEETLDPDKQAKQMQLPADVDAALLQQVMNLTREQLSLLPPEQQQQVLQLQQMLQNAM